MTQQTEANARASVLIRALLEDCQAVVLELRQRLEQDSRNVHSDREWRGIERRYAAAIRSVEHRHEVIMEWWLEGRRVVCASRGCSSLTADFVPEVEAFIVSQLRAEHARVARQFDDRCSVEFVAMNRRLLAPEAAEAAIADDAFMREFFQKLERREERVIIRVRQDLAKEAGGDVQAVEPQ